MNSLCKMIGCDPATCAFCALVRSPAPLTAKAIAGMLRGRQVRPVAVAAPQVDHAAEARRAALAAEVAALKAENAALATRRAVGLHPAPVAAQAPQARPAALSGFDISGLLSPMDWVGLAARVEAGAITTAQAESIGSKWLQVMPVGVLS